MEASGTPKTPNVFRLHIRPGGGSADSALSFAHCLAEKVLGLGWAVGLPPETRPTWDEYEALAKEEHRGENGEEADLGRVRFLHNRVRARDLIWTRDTRGKYYLAKVESPWEYHETPASRAPDIVNFVRCRILAVPEPDDVPGKVVACFRARRTIQSIVDPTSVAYSQLLWNRLSCRSDYVVVANGAQSIYSYLDSETMEDLIFIYLQMQGWVVIPNSRKADTMGFEYVLINRETHERAVAQVKTGNASLNRESWKDFGQRVFLFQANGLYFGEETPSVTCIAPSEIESFMRAERDIMPRVVRLCLEYVDGADHPL
jgi:hypothetical protein